MATPAQVVALASERTFNSPLVTNVFRSVLVEAMIATTLPEWIWCSSDYASHDFEHRDGARLEVKQTALRQTWISANPSVPSWDIKVRTGRWKDGATWIPGIGRNADIYVFGYHPVVDATADHRDPAQWQFYVVATSNLPNTQRLSHRRAQELTGAVLIGQLAGQVELARLEFARSEQTA